jgi:hypothetical protein
MVPFFMLKAVSVAKRDGRQSYVEGSVWSDLFDHQSDTELKSKVKAETASTTAGGPSSSTVWIAVAAVAVAACVLVVWLIARGRRGRAPEE